MSRKSSKLQKAHEIMGMYDIDVEQLELSALEELKEHTQ